MGTIVTEIEARRSSTEVEPEMTQRAAVPRSAKPGVKAWAVSLIALGAVAGGVIAGPRLLMTAAGTVESADQKAAEQRAAQAAIDTAMAAVRDAQFDLDHTRIAAPFTGRIGTHLVSVGNLISGSRAGTSPTTLLATIVSTDSIYLNFDMSEADYMTFLPDRQKRAGPLAHIVQIALAAENHFTHAGTLDFVDNTLDRSSGTIH